MLVSMIKRDFRFYTNDHEQTMFYNERLPSQKASKETCSSIK